MAKIAYMKIEMTNIEFAPYLNEVGKPIKDEYRTLKIEEARLMKLINENNQKRREFIEKIKKHWTDKEIKQAVKVYNKSMEFSNFP